MQEVPSWLDGDFDSALADLDLSSEAQQVCIRDTDDAYKEHV